MAETTAPIRVHGSLVEVAGVGVLITGRSGIGKSECALDLIVRGHRLGAGGIVFVAPFAILGVRIGSRIHTSLSAVQLRRAIGALLVTCGVVLLARSLL